jgi:hypothetical protein
LAVCYDCYGKRLEVAEALLKSFVSEKPSENEEMMRNNAGSQSLEEIQAFLHNVTDVAALGISRKEWRRSMAAHVLPQGKMGGLQS